MKKIFTYLLICLCLLFLTACPVKMEVTRIRSFVVGFNEATSFEMQLTEDSNIALYWSNLGRWVFYSDRGLERMRYDELASRYNDLGYNRITGTATVPIHRSYISNRITSIDVVSDTDFNAEHLAGTSLAGFVRLLSASPMRFIQSGYQETFDWDRDFPANFLKEATLFSWLRIGGYFNRYHRWVSTYPNHFPINEVLSELERDDFRLLGTGGTYHPSPSGGEGWLFGFLVFDKKPENLGTHNLTVTIYRTCGQVLRQTIRKTFGE